MIYCVSDIHGDLDKLERMMELIRFSDADHLYIIGDVIDRGVMGVDILRWIMVAPNMTMLLGNHEQMCLDTLGPKNEFGARGTSGGRTGECPPIGSCSIIGCQRSEARSCAFWPVCRIIWISRSADGSFILFTAARRRIGTPAFGVA